MAYRSGSEEAAEALFARYYWRLRTLVGREFGANPHRIGGVSDVVQSALGGFFSKARKNELEIDPERGLWPYLVTLTLNKVRDRLRYAHRDRRDIDRVIPIERCPDPLESDPAPEDIAVASEMVERLLEPFTPRRRAIVRHLLLGYGVKETAQAVGASERTVYATRQAACLVLRDLLRDKS
ncbi:RNA polymerase sigma factor [Kolteria novifilia]|uniref:RNA polymerase sigma factor n=1 Tax=Kolteria novifilia TaxID=2527975 RepID=UPI003AF36509